MGVLEKVRLSLALFESSKRRICQLQHPHRRVRQVNIDLPRKLAPTNSVSLSASQPNRYEPSHSVSKRPKFIDMQLDLQSRRPMHEICQRRSVLLSMSIELVGAVLQHPCGLQLLFQQFTMRGLFEWSDDLRVPREQNRPALSNSIGLQTKQMRAWRPVHLDAESCRHRATFLCVP